jgi:Mn2+/Fe2+ NRAMP family transporter
MCVCVFVFTLAFCFLLVVVITSVFKSRVLRTFIQSHHRFKNDILVIINTTSDSS